MSGDRGGPKTEEKEPLQGGKNSAVIGIPQPPTTIQVIPRPPLPVPPQSCPREGRTLLTEGNQEKKQRLCKREEEEKTATVIELPNHCHPQNHHEPSLASSPPPPASLGVFAIVFSATRFVPLLVAVHHFLAFHCSSEI